MFLLSLFKGGQLLKSFPLFRIFSATRLSNSSLSLHSKGSEQMLLLREDVPCCIHSLNVERTLKMLGSCLCNWKITLNDRQKSPP